MLPLVVPTLRPPWRGRRGRGVAFKPAPDVVLIELLGPEEPGERLPHHALGVVREPLRDDRLVELVGLSHALTEDSIEVLAERAGRKRRVGEPEPRDDALAGLKPQPIVRGGLRAEPLRDDRVLSPLPAEAL